MFKIYDSKDPNSGVVSKFNKAPHVASENVAPNFQLPAKAESKKSLFVAESKKSHLVVAAVASENQPETKKVVIELTENEIQKITKLTEELWRNNINNNPFDADIF